MYTCTFHLTRTNCTPHTQPGRGVVIIAPPTVRYSEQFLYAAILRRASHCVRYPEFGGCPLFGCFYCIICMETAVGACNSVRYSVDVRYWECPLIESPLYSTRYFVEKFTIGHVAAQRGRLNYITNANAHVHILD